MKYEILPNGNLRISATEEERKDIVPPESDEFLYEGECLERLIANSELDWIPEGVTDDLTSAPMLGILAEEGYSGPTFNRPHRGAAYETDTPKIDHPPIIARWAYMDYQARSFVDDLIETGECVWEGGYAELEVSK